MSLGNPHFQKEPEAWILKYRIIPFKKVNSFKMFSTHGIESTVSRYTATLGSPFGVLFCASRTRRLGLGRDYVFSSLSRQFSGHYSSQQWLIQERATPPKESEWARLSLMLVFSWPSLESGVKEGCGWSSTLAQQGQWPLWTSRKCHS
jgi:hypothetical protein